MISFILEDRCNGCGVCVVICPTNVFERSASVPQIARPDDCQTCFMCELYCETDAIYVDPDCEHRVAIDRDAIIADGLMGQFRRDSGWHEWEGDPRYTNEHWRMSELFARAASMKAST